MIMPETKYILPVSIEHIYAVWDNSTQETLREIRARPLRPLVVAHKLQLQQRSSHPSILGMLPKEHSSRSRQRPRDTAATLAGRVALANEPVGGPRIRLGENRTHGTCF